MTAVSGSVLYAQSTSFQWYSNYIPITGATSSTLDSSNYSGIINVVELATGSTGTVVYSMSADFSNGSLLTLKGTADFNSATTNFQKYSTLSTQVLTLAGGNQTEQDKITVKISGASKGLVLNGSLVDVTVSGKISHGLAYLNSNLTPNQRVEVDTIAALGLNPGRVILWYIDEFNYIYLIGGGTGTSYRMGVHKVVNGVDTDILFTRYTNAGGAPGFYLRAASAVSNYTLRLDIINNNLYVYDKVDAETTFTPHTISRTAAGAALANSLDLTLDPDVIPGNMAGALPTGSTTTYDTMRFYSFSQPLTVSTTTTDTYNNAPILSMSVLYSGTTDPTGFDVAVVRSDGTPIIARKAATSVGTISGGTATLTLSDTALRALEGKSGYVQVWKTGPGLTGQEGAAQSFSMPVYQTVFQYRQGINEGYTTGVAADVFRDLSQSSRITAGAGAYNVYSANVPLNQYALPMTLDPVYPGGITFILKEPQYTVPARQGTFIVTYPTHLTIHGNSNAQLDFIGLPAGQARYTRGATSSNPLIWFTGGGFANNEFVSIIPEFDANPQRLITDVAANNYSSLGSVLRCMTARMTNSVHPTVWKSQTDTSFVRFSAADRRSAGSTYIVPFSVEQFVSACNQANVDMYWNAKHIDDETVWRAEAQYAAAHLNPGINVMLEFSNEVWNGQFYQGYDMIVDAARIGLIADGINSYASRTGDATVYFNSYSNIVNSTVAVPNQGLMVCKVDSVGTVVLRANMDNPIGTPVWSGTGGSDGVMDSTHWTLVYGNNQTGNSVDRMQAHYSDRLITIWTEEFNAVGRPVPSLILGSQKGNALGPDIKLMLNWVCQDGSNMYDKAKFIATAPYWKDAGSGNLGDYTADYASPPYKNPWTTTEKNLVTSNFTAFKAAFIAIANEVIDDQLNDDTAFKHSIAAFLVSKNRNPDSIQLCSYEANHHVQYSNWPTGALATAAGTAFATIMRSPEWGDLCVRYTKGLAQRIGGTHMIFDRIAIIPTTGADGTSRSPEQVWCLQEAETDNATSGASKNYRYTAYSNAKNGIFTSVA